MKNFKKKIQIKTPQRHYVLLICNDRLFVNVCASEFYVCFAGESECFQKKLMLFYLIFISLLI